MGSSRSQSEARCRVTIGNPRFETDCVRGQVAPGSRRLFIARLITRIGLVAAPTRHYPREEAGSSR